MRLDRLWIAAHVPQRGAMCLLEEVLEWDASGVLCRAESHRAIDHPLRAHGRLGVASAIEYAAQAMAVHGALLAPERFPPQTPGLLASTRGVAFHVERLDDIAGSLFARATHVHGDASMVLYDFTVSDASRALVTGRAAIAFAARPGGTES